MKILYIDDDPFCQRVADRLTQLPGSSSLGVFASPERGLATAVRLRPDVLVFAAEFATVSRLARGPLREIQCDKLLTAWKCDEGLIVKAAELEARAVVLKTASFLAEMAAAIAALARRGTWYSPGYAENLSRLRGDPNSALKLFSGRELAILRQIALAKSNGEIAAECALSAASVQWYRKRICRKLGLHSTAETVAWAIARGLVSLCEFRPAAKKP